MSDERGINRPLMQLVSEAVRLGGGDLCASGHDWETAGGKACRHSHSYGDCSETVHQCARCGEYDYGDFDPPSIRDCELCPTFAGIPAMTPTANREGRRG